MARLNRGGHEATEEKGVEGNRLQFPSTEPSGEHLPDVPQDLINYLNRAFPNELPPDGSDPVSALHRAWGRRDVIEHLIGLKRQIEQENHVLRR